MATDDVIYGCLERLRKCDVSAAGVLADHLEEIGHPLAKRVRKAWETYTRGVNYWSSDERDFSRGRWTRWESLAYFARKLRGEIGRLFKRRWRTLPLSAFGKWSKT